MRKLNVLLFALFCAGAAYGSNPILTTNSNENNYIDYSTTAGKSPSGDVIIYGNIYSLPEFEGKKGSGIISNYAPCTFNISSITFTAPGCNGGDNGTASITTSGGVAPYTYSWSNGASVSTITGLTVGTYSISVTDKNGCNATAAVALTQPALLSANAIITYPLCNGQTGSATIGVTGGISPYTYKWTPSITTGSTATGLAVRSYNVLVTDSNRCTSNVAFNITQPNAIRDSVVSGASSGSSCNNANNGMITIGTKYGVSPYTYTWSPNVSSSSTAGGLSIGTYTISITDANGCTGSTSYTITQPNALVLAPVITNRLTCNGNTNGAIVAGVTGGVAPYTYSWTPSVTTTSTATGLTVGTYSISVTDKNGCNATAAVALTQPPLLSANAIITYPLCNGQTGAATIGVTGGISPYTYKWTPSITTGSTATGLAVRSYNVLVTDSNRCTFNVAFNITQPNAIRDSVVSGASSGSSCNNANNGMITIGTKYGVSPYTYTWSPNVSSSSTAAGLSVGTYSISITDANGCTGSTSYTITQPNVLVLAPVITNRLTCNGNTNGAIVAGVTGGVAPYTYSWTPSVTTTSTATGLTVGTYSISVTDKNGCNATAAVALTQPALLSANAIITYPLCNGQTGSATIGVTGGISPYTYKWTPGVSLTATATGLAVRSYNVLVTDSNRCTFNVVFNITQPNAIRDSVVSGASSGSSCNNANNGIITIGTKYGVSPYTYSWSPNVSSSSTAAGLSVGTYSISITDANGCSGSTSYTLTQPNALVVKPVITSSITCGGAPEGVIVATLSGGTSPYTYLWNPNVTTTSTATGLTAGTYTITVFDKNGCNVTASPVTLTQPSPIIVTTHNDSTCLGYQVQLSASASGGTGTYKYFWITGANADTTTVAPTTDTTYTIYVSDSKNCVDSAVSYVKVTVPPIVIFNITTHSVCSTATKDSLLGSPTGGTYRGPGVTGGNFNPSAVGPGTWNLTYTYSDTAGCSVTALQSVIVYVCTGIPDLSNDSRIAIYPNPATDEFTLQFKDGDSPRLVELYTISGQQVYEHKYATPLNSQLLTVNAQQFSTGVYFLKVLLQDGSTLVQKVEIVR